MPAEYAQSSPYDVCQSQLATDRSVPAFWMLLAAYVGLWTVVPCLTQPNLPIDSVEMVHWGREWQWGYYKHPPLPAWVAQLTSMAFGSANWPMYLVAELATAVGFWAVWRMGRELLAPWLALCAVAMLQGCFHFNWSSSEVNNNTITRPFWAVAVLMLYWALRHKQLRYWIGYGVAMALGLYSKYDVLFLGAGVTWLLIWNAEARQSWRTAGPYLAAVIIATLLLPHAIWLIENDFPTFTYALNRADDAKNWADHVVNPLVFAIKQAPLVLPVLALAIPLLGFIPRLRRLTTNELLARDTLVAATLAPCLLLIFFSALTGSKLRTGWTAQVWTYLGLLALYSLEFRRFDGVAIARTLKSSAVVALVALVGLSMRNILNPAIDGKPSRVHYPGRQLADAVETIWRRSSDEVLPVVAANDWWTVANISCYAPSQPSTLYLGSPAFTPWSSDAELSRTGGMLVEQVDDDDAARRLTNDWRQRFPGAGTCKIVTIPWRTSCELVPVRFLVVPVTPQHRLAAQSEAATSTR